MRVSVNVAVPSDATDAVPNTTVPWALMILNVTVPPIGPTPVQFAGVTVATQVILSLYCCVTGLVTGVVETTSDVVVVTLFTSTMKEHVDVLPQASVAVHLIVLLPKFNNTPAIVVFPLVVVAPLTLHPSDGFEQASDAVELNSVPYTA